MKSLFVRFYAALGVGHAVGVLVWVLSAAAIVPRVAQEHLAAVLEGPTAAMVERLAEASPSQRQAILEGWQHTPASLVAPLEAMPGDAVRRGELLVVVDYPYARVYRAIDASMWLSLGPLPLVPAGVELRWASLALLATLGIGVGAQVALQPVRRTLDRLATVARAFGAGDLTARARVSGPAELEQVGSAFDAMADRIHALLRIQQETLQGVSHELRTPLTRARFALELVSDTDDRAQRVELAEKAAGDLDQMERLLEELLAYLRLDALRELARSPTDLRELAASIVEPGSAVTVRGTGAAEVEPTLIRRALRNLVANAQRHARSSVAVDVGVEDGVAVIAVEDDGPGIPPAERERVGQPFARGDSARALDPSGAGLGLAIAARVVAAHGGKLSVGESALGGARVCLVFPVRAPLA